jgi:hypothetical protein
MAGDPLDTLKQIREIIKKANDRELVRLVLDLQKEVFALESEYLKVNAELLKLKREADLRRKMHLCPPSYYYFQDGDDVPFCPVCWESRGKAIHLRPQSHAESGVRRECRVCKQTFWEKAADTKAKAASQH